MIIVNQYYNITIWGWGWVGVWDLYALCFWPLISMKLEFVVMFTNCIVCSSCFSACDILTEILEHS